jgi:hypothetical protein
MKYKNLFCEPTLKKSWFYILTQSLKNLLVNLLWTIMMAFLHSYVMLDMDSFPLPAIAHHLQPQGRKLNTVSFILTSWVVSGIPKWFLSASGILEILCFWTCGWNFCMGLPWSHVFVFMKFEVVALQNVWLWGVELVESCLMVLLWDCFLYKACGIITMMGLCHTG